MWSILITQVAWAQGVPEINAQHFRPTVDGDRTLWVDDSMRLPETDVQFRALFHYVDSPLVFEGVDGEVTEIVSDVLQADVMLGAQLDRLRVALDLPIYLLSNSEASPDNGGFGDVALDSKLTLTEQGAGAPLGTALSARVSLPTSTLDAALGSPTVGWELSGIVDREVGPVLLAANVGVRGGPRAELVNVVLDDYLTLRGAVAYALDADTGLAAEVASSLALTELANSAANPTEWLLSGYRHMGSGIVLRAGGGTGIGSGIMAPDFRALVGFAYEPERDVPKDLDGDGWVDAEDPCPSEPEDDDGVADDGCPEPDPDVSVRVVDALGASVPGAVVTVAQGDHPVLNGVVAGVQFPPGTYDIDASAPGFNDAERALTVVGDEGVIDVVLTLEPVAVGELQVSVRDAAGPLDASIVIAGVEVGTGASWTGPLDSGSHPMVVSAAGFKPVKQVVEIATGEVVQLEVVLEPALVVLEVDRIDIRESVFFATATATIQPVSFGLLDEVAQLLVDHPELTRLRVEGHTDSRGNAAYNKTLSQQRADSVAAYLTSHGVDAGRLEAVGFGEERPLDDRELPAAWERNRRVDFFVAERAE